MMDGVSAFALSEKNFSFYLLTFLWAGAIKGHENDFSPIASNLTEVISVARRSARTLTEVELEFMLIVWDLGEVTTEDMLKGLSKTGRDLSDGSVRKILSILLRKGYLSRRKEGRGFVYWATVPEGQAKRSMLVDLLKRAFDGSAALLVASLLDTREVRKGDIEEIRRLIAEHEREGIE